MDKLTRYNQKLLAVIGTTALAGVGLFVLLGVGALAFELFDGFNNTEVRDNSLTLDMPEDSVYQAKPAVRDQEISIGKLQLIDTLHSIYLIPVSQVNLKNPEFTNENEGGFDASSSYSLRKSKYGYRHSGTYNNLIIYDQRRSENALVFHKRTHISAFRHVTIEDEQYLLIEGLNQDSNKDNKLTNSDLKSFFTYKISTKELNEFSYESMGLVDYYLTFGSDEVILRFAKDKDENGEINSYQESIYSKKLNLTTNKISELIDQSLLDKIQTIID